MERGRRLDRALADVLASAPQLPDRDRRLAHEIAYGVTRLRGRLDHLIARHSKPAVSDLRPVVLEAMRMGAYQALYMHSIPDYAAVSTSVTLARKREGPRAGRLVNAVLRRVIAEGGGEALFPAWKDDPVGFLSTWGSHPDWLVKRWLDRWGADETKELVEANNRRPKTFLVPLDGDVEGARRALASLVPGARAEAGTSEQAGTSERAGAGRKAPTSSDAFSRASNDISCETPARATANRTTTTRAANTRAATARATTIGCVALPPGVSPRVAIRTVPGSVIQDPAAHLVVRYAEVLPSARVVDLCAAPGGKALALAGLGADVLAQDISELRLRLLADAARRAGLTVRCFVGDAAEPAMTRADVVLVDAPCTGTGTLARRPDARWRLAFDSPTRLAAVQARILRGAARVVTPGGLLVYSTCTLEPEENERQVEAFLAEHPDFDMEPARLTLPDGLLGPRGLLVASPQATGCDGAFAARMRRRGSVAVPTAHGQGLDVRGPYLGSLENR